jgi:hypothetical protein
MAGFGVVKKLIRFHHFFLSRLMAIPFACYIVTACKTSFTVPFRATLPQATVGNWRKIRTSAVLWRNKFTNITFAARSSIHTIDIYYLAIFCRGLFKLYLQERRHIANLQSNQSDSRQIESQHKCSRSFDYTVLSTLH